MSASLEKLTLPSSWPAVVRSAMLQVISLAQYAAVYTRSWAADSSNARVRLRADCDQIREEAALLREEMRIKDARMTSIPLLWSSDLSRAVVCLKRESKS